jgi:DNA-directed RNA polymerase subunit beta
MAPCPSSASSRRRTASSRAARSDEIVYLDASEAVHNRPGAQSGSTRRPATSCRSRCCAARGPEAVMVSPKDVELMDVSASQIVSVATALDPVPRAQRREPRPDGSEHAAAGSAADDPAGAARRHRESVSRRVDTGDVVMSRSAGSVIDVDAETIVVEGRGRARSTTSRSSCARTRARLSTRSRSSSSGQGEQGHRPRGRVLHTAASSRSAPTCSSRSCRSRATTSRTRSCSPKRLVKDDVLSSIHPRVRDRRPLDEAGREEVTRDIPNRSEGVAREPRRARCRADRSRGRLRRPCSSAR